MLLSVGNSLASQNFALTQNLQRAAQAGERDVVSSIFQLGPDLRNAFRLLEEAFKEKIIFRDANAHDLAPSPDGKWLAYTYSPNPKNGTESRLAMISPDGGTPRDILTIRGPEILTLDSVSTLG